MQAKTAVLLGATGLIGSHLLQLLLNNDRYTHVRAIVRKPLNINHPKLETCIVDFNNENAYPSATGTGDAIFCCIGTTMKNVKGDKALYRKIDFDIPVKAAQWGINNNFSQYLLVSAIGANSASSNFYIKLKGEVEDAISALNYPSAHIFRPSLLMGNRKEQRGMEKFLQKIFPAISFLLPAKYKPVQAEDVAKAMLAASFITATGTSLHTYSNIISLAK